MHHVAIFFDYFVVVSYFAVMLGHAGGEWVRDNPGECAACVLMLVCRDSVAIGEVITIV